MKQLPLLTETPGRPPARQKRARLSPTMHLGEAVPVWADHLQREGMMPRTIKAFWADIQRLIAHHGNVAVRTVSTRDLEQWLQVERKQSAPKSAMRRMLEYLLLAIAKPAGLVGRLTFDDCRWVYAVRLARAGTDFDLIRRNLGLSKSQWQEIGRKVRQLSQIEGGPTTPASP